MSWSVCTAGGRRNTSGQLRVGELIWNQCSHRPSTSPLWPCIPVMARFGSSVKSYQRQEVTPFLLELGLNGGSFNANQMWVYSREQCRAIRPVGENGLRDTAFKIWARHHPNMRAVRRARGRYICEWHRARARHVPPEPPSVVERLPHKVPPSNSPRSCRSAWPMKGLNVFSKSAFRTLPEPPAVEWK